MTSHGVGSGGWGGGKPRELGGGASESCAMRLLGLVVLSARACRVPFPVQTALRKHVQAKVAGRSLLSLVGSGAP